MLLALTSLRGSPGVTTLSVVMARIAAEKGWKATVVEADAEGGMFGFVYPGLDPEKNLLEYAVASRRDDDRDLFDAHTQKIDADSDANLLVAPPLGVEVARALSVGYDRIVDIGSDPDRLLIVDCGRLSNVGAAIFAAAHRRFMVARPTREAALGLYALYGANPADVESLSTVIVGDRPHSAAEINQLGVKVSAVVDDDRRIAEMMWGEDFSVRKFQKSSLHRSASALVPELSEAPPRDTTPVVVPEEDQNENLFIEADDDIEEGGDDEFLFSAGDTEEQVDEDEPIFVSGDIDEDPGDDDLDDLFARVQEGAPDPPPDWE